MGWVERIFSCLCMALLLTACEKTETRTVEDIWTQKTIPEGKIPVTILVKYAFSINEFERAAEKKFPQLDIIQVGNYTFDRGLVEYQRRLEHDDLDLEIEMIFSDWVEELNRKCPYRRILNAQILKITPIAYATIPFEI